MKELVIIGAGDFGKEVAWLIEDINKETPQYKVLGFLDDDEAKVGQRLNGTPVLGKTTILPCLSEERGVRAVIAMQDGAARKSIAERFPCFQNWETLIHPTAVISTTSKMGKGCIICARTSISVNIEIGDHCILNTGVTLGHDVFMDSYASIMPGAILSGHVKTGEGAYFGTNSTVIPGQTVGAWSKVGAGSTVLWSVRSGVSVMGIPARAIRELRKESRESSVFEMENRPGGVKR